MIGEKIIEQKPINLAQVKQLLSDRKKEKDLTYEQDITFKYAKKFSKLSFAQAKKLETDLTKEEGLSKETIVKIVDVLPTKKEKLQLLIPKDTVLNDASLQKVLDLCKKYSK